MGRRDQSAEGEAALGATAAEDGPSTSVLLSDNPSEAKVKHPSPLLRERHLLFKADKVKAVSLVAESFGLGSAERNSSFFLSCSSHDLWCMNCPYVAVYYTFLLLCAFHLCIPLIIATKKHVFSCCIERVAVLCALPLGVIVVMGFRRRSCRRTRPECHIQGRMCLQQPPAK